MYFQKPGRNSENLVKVSKKPMATLKMDEFMYFQDVLVNLEIIY